MSSASEIPSPRTRRPNRHRLRSTVLWILGVLVLLVVGVLFWAHSVMLGERPASLEVWRNPDITVTATDHSVVLSPTNNASEVGLVFIPGAKVDPYAYMYKLSGIVEQTGATVVITKPTLNLAFFDTRPLDTFTNDAPEVTEWFVGGHSLGGVRACQMADTADAAADGVTGLVLFGSYCANDLSDSGLRVLSISGSDDGLSTPAKIDEAAHLLPADTVFVEIDGANHASFGDYGVQPGDGTATIDDTEMRREITDALQGFGL
ncbi:alpha/beta hydrolase [Microterricola pindariensis]|uniref:Alpha/beta hydrolase n=1 Tax=Microterricola pindariensis TaxID=478010 RepID=A0ABX5AXQ4_9MICO|nr:alpha/beta hydrolase [Microterricola pindariensis]PPL19607.1 alpha/beta hydrolase [Microterricola pindariensis]